MIEDKEMDPRKCPIKLCRLRKTRICKGKKFIECFIYQNVKDYDEDIIIE